MAAGDYLRGYGVPAATGGRILSAPTPARRAAYETLRRVFEEGAWADRALRSAAGRYRLEGRERAQAQALAYGAVQRRGTSDHLAAQLADRPIERIDPPLQAALRLGLFELLYATGDADHAAVDQAVSLAKGRGGNRRGAGLVNAVLRRASREREDLLAGLDNDDPAGAAVAHSVPLWLAELWWEELGADSARSLLAAINDPPERTLRVNTLRSDRETALESLRSAGVEASVPAPGRPPVPRDFVIVTGGERKRVEEMIGEGTLVPQSRASGRVVELLAPQPGERVLDLCAGPGIKASQIAAALGASGSGLVAVEGDPGRARELTEMLQGVGAGAAVVEQGDASDRARTAAGPHSTRSSSTHRAPASERSPRDRIHAGDARPRRSSRWPASRAGSSTAPSRRSRREDGSSTRSARSPAGGRGGGRRRRNRSGRPRGRSRERDPRVPRRSQVPADTHRSRSNRRLLRGPPAP